MNVVAHLLEPSIERYVVGRLFVKGLALVYAVAFASLAVQIDGLAGPEGILPLARLLNGAFAQQRYAAVWHVPTLFWIDSSTVALEGSAIAGMAFALLLLAGAMRPRPVLIVLYVLYLSLYHAGQIFTRFQWDYLLLESGLLAIYVADAPTRLVVLLYDFLLFRLRFLSGFFKLASGDESWRHFTALDYYFETQPLPHVGSWYAHLSPEWLLRTGVGFTFLAELLVPFFIFLPRRFRILAAAVTIAAQLLIIATSNHNFINLLTILLCVFLLDDRILERVLPGRLFRLLSSGSATARRAGLLSNVLLGATAVLVVTLSVVTFANTQVRRPLHPLHGFEQIATSFGIGNVFHLFPTMQTERQELQIQGSYDGVAWQPYEFHFKPGALDRAPRFIVPYQPRLDWMMWFVPPQWIDTGYWFDPFLQALRENRPAVTHLLARNPFEQKPRPSMVRVLVYRYRFTSAQERDRSGRWWSAELLGEYPDVPPRRP